MNSEFRTLVLHFFKRFFDTESRSSDSDAYTGIVQLLALLVMPGLVLSYFMMTDPPAARDTVARLWGRVGDRYVFICYSMVVMGLLMTFKWDSLFPDRRDYLILSPLPISTRKMFAAKVAALAAFLMLFVVAVNFFSLLIAPAVYPNPTHSWSWRLDAFIAHALGVLGAALFTVFFFAALQGVLINLLTPTAFRRISPRIQMVSITVLVMLFLTLPLFKQGIRPLSERYPDALGYFPSIWFLGLYEAFLPGEWLMAPAYVWGRTALAAIIVIATVCAASYLVGYRRYSAKILESIDSDALPPLWWQRLTNSILNRTILRDPFQRATFYFIGRIANRSPKHRIMTAVYTGVGIALAVSFAFIFDPKIRGAFPFRLSPAGSLEAPVMLSFLIITGLRATFNIPYELGANWVFQITAGNPAVYLRAVRKWVFVCRIVPLYVLLAVLEFKYFPAAAAMSHLVFDLLLSAIVIEIFFLNFNKVPFTCSYPRDKFRMAALAIGYFYGFVTYVAGMGLLKRWAASTPRNLVFFMIVALVIRAAISAYRRRVRDRAARVVYHDTDTTTPLSIAGDQGYWQAHDARYRARKSASSLRTHSQPPEPGKRRMMSAFSWTVWEQLLQDIRFGSRILWKSPGLSATAVILIALVIGANTTIYSIVHALMARPAPGVTAQNLYYVGLVGVPSEPLHSYPDYLDYASQSKTLRSLFAFGPERITLAVDDGSYAMFGAHVSANYFDAIGVRLSRGRTFTPQDNRMTAGLVAVISHRVWLERFQGKDDVIGRRLQINGHDATIIGLAPPKFQGVDLGLPEDVWLPVVSYFRAAGRESVLMDRDNPEAVMVVGQLAPDTSVVECEAEIRTISARLRAAFPSSHKPIAPRLVKYSGTTNGGIAQIGGRFLAIFSIVTAITLLVVCSNVANLMLARSLAKQRETAVRQSFGASRFRLLRMSVTEGFAISLAAWAGVCLFAVWLSKAIPWLVPTNATGPQGMRPNHMNLDFTPDWTVLGYAMILAVAGTLAFILAPAIRTWRRQLLPYLKAGEQSVAPGRSRLSSILVVTQLAFSVLLLTAAALAYRSLSIIDTRNLHFDRENLLLITVNPTLSITNRQVQLSLVEQMQERLRSIPGVTAVSYVRLPPPFSWGRENFEPPGSQESVVARTNYVGPGFLRSLGLAPVAGRDFSPADRAGGLRAAVITESLAAALWPGQPAVGQTLLLERQRERVEVIGMAPNAFFAGFQADAAPNFVFLAEQQDVGRRTAGAGLRESGETTFYVKYSGGFSAVASAVSKAVKEVDSRVPIIQTRTMEAQLAATNGEGRIVTFLLSIFSVISIVIAAIGQYAVIAFDMKRRTREFGVRVAMGASSQQIVAAVVREGLLLTAAGLAVGFLLSAVAGMALARFLYGVTATDPPTYLAAFAIMGTTSLLACYLPARRASRVDPLVALRWD
jgi:predicted permease